MSRRDMIIIAVLLNAAVLSFLFLTATRQGGDEDFQPIYEQVISLDFPEESSKEAKPGVIELEAGPRDEVDQAIKPYLTGQESPLPPIETFRDQSVQETKVDPKEFTEVTVKRGDVLEKIARVNGTTVKELKRFNNLSNDKISIGQVLKIPKAGATAAVVTPAAQPVEAPSTAQYYVVKAGDNPWKIARLNKVKVEDLLTLNGLTEESARNLKVGDKIRVR
jgi:peptidoglycan DL-endopeptidase LytF